MHLRWHICAETFRRIASNYVVPAVCIGVGTPAPAKNGVVRRTQKNCFREETSHGKEKEGKEGKREKGKGGSEGIESRRNESIELLMQMLMSDPPFSGMLPSAIRRAES